MKKKPTIFISHINEEIELATILKRRLSELPFLSDEKIFLAADGQSIALGELWRPKIDDALKEAEIVDSPPVFRGASWERI